MNNKDNSNNYKEEVPNVWLMICSFIIPLGGLIFYIVFKNDKPKTSKGCGIAGLVGLLIQVIISVITTSLVI